MESEEEKKAKKKKIRHILIGTGIGTVLFSSFLLWYFKFRKGVNINDPKNDLFHKLSQQNVSAEQDVPPVQNKQQPVYTPPAQQSSSFPLTKGSRGSLVKQLQTALINTYGKSILPKYGADGDFGSETINALTSKAYPSSIDKDTFDKIVSGNTSTDTNAPTIVDSSPLPPGIELPVDVAKNIWNNANTKNLPGMLSELQRIETVKDYVIINALFKTLYLRGVRQTIVNGCLSTFSDEASKQQIRNEFLRIGLKNKNNKWSLAGLAGRQLMTTRATTIQSMDGLSMDVPSETLLGLALSGTDKVTAFRTIDNETLYVPTKHVSYV